MLGTFKILAVSAATLVMAACGNAPQCPSPTGYSQSQYQQPVSSSQYYQEPVVANSNRVGDLVTGAAVGAAVGHLATKNSNKAKTTTSSNTPKSSVVQPKTTYKKAVVSKPKPVKKKVSLSKSKSYKSSSSKRR